MEIDTTILVVCAFIMGLAPFCGIVWVIIAKMALEVFQTADIQALTEKANPVLVPGTQTSQSTQTK
jgi:hypothetical protein